MSSRNPLIYWLLKTWDLSQAIHYDFVQIDPPWKMARCILEPWPFSARCRSNRPDLWRTTNAWRVPRLHPLLHWAWAPGLRTQPPPIEDNPLSKQQAPALCHPSLCHLCPPSAETALHALPPSCNHRVNFPKDGQEIDTSPQLGQVWKITTSSPRTLTKADLGLPM